MRFQDCRGRRLATLAVSAVLACALPVTLAGCGNDAADGSAATDSAAAAEEQKAPEVQSDYAVTIDGSTLTTDYEGAPAIIVDYTFTNNSDEDTSFAVACSAQAFQNGVQLENAIVMDDLGNGYLAEIKPGASTQARLAYSLTDQSEVSVEVEELFALEDIVLAETTFSVA